MTIGEAVTILNKLKEKYGDVEIFFDCPTCRQSFKPAIVATQAVHFTHKE